MQGQNHKGQEVIHHAENHRAQPQVYVKRFKYRPCGKRSDEKVHPHGQYKKQYDYAAPSALGQDISHGVPDNQAKQRGNNPHQKRKQKRRQAGAVPQQGDKVPERQLSVNQKSVYQYQRQGYYHKQQHEQDIRIGKNASCYAEVFDFVF